MKRVSNLYEKIATLDNVYQAIKNASKGKSNRRNVQKVLSNIDYYANNIYEMLKNESYIPSEYREKIIKDGVNGKERLIHIPKFYPDQIIHWCLMNVLQPILHRKLYAYCCASIKGRGIHYGKRYIEKIIANDKRNTKYVLKLDIRKYYPNVDKELLKDKFSKIIKDEKTLNLIGLIINSNVKGIPIGNYTSQWFANFYLRDTDIFIKEVLKAKYYIRYMDDIVIFGSNKRDLHKKFLKLNEFIKTQKLEFKKNWQVFPLRRRFLDFLGFKFYPNHTTLRKKLYLRLRRLSIKINKSPTKKKANSFMSYYGWYKVCNSHNLIETNNINITRLKELIRYENTI